MEKMRSAFGLEKEAKEGQAFDRDLQERLKAERIAEKEAKQEAKQKQEKKRKKEAKKAEKAAKKLATKKAKEAEKAAALMEQVYYRRLLLDSFQVVFHAKQCQRAYSFVRPILRSGFCSKDQSCKGN